MLRIFKMEEGARRRWKIDELKNEEKN